MERFLLVLLLVALCGLAAYGLYVGWRHREERQQSVLPELTVAPADLGPDLVEPVTGLYISTTTSGTWQDRIVAHGLGRRAAGAMRLSAEGICIERDGESDIFIPTGDLRTISTAPGIAGKVMGMADGVLVVTWMLGEKRLDIGYRADDSDAQAQFILAARTLIATNRRTQAGPAKPEPAAADQPTTGGAVPVTEGPTTGAPSTVAHSTGLPSTVAPSAGAQRSGMPRARAPRIGMPRTARPRTGTPRPGVPGANGGQS